MPILTLTSLTLAGLLLPPLCGLLPKSHNTAQKGSFILPRLHFKLTQPTQLLLGHHQSPCLRCHRVLIRAYPFSVSELVRNVDTSQEHPGGSSIILKYAGRDATSVYEPIHPPDALEKNLPKSKHLGPLNSDASKIISEANKAKTKTKDELRVEQALKERPPLVRILSLADMEVRSFSPPPTNTQHLLASCQACHAS